MENTQLSRIESRIDKSVTKDTGLTTTGAMNFSSVEQIMEFAKVMAIAGVAVPKHLRENPGACLAVAIQASEWQMSPFAVASKTYVVNDRLGFEAQLVAAVILKRAPIKGRIKYAFTGDGAKRRCTASAVLQEDGSTVEYQSPEIATIPTKNSPLWKGDPDQQLGYYSVRAMCRRHFPDVILGIYTPEELAEATDIEAQVTPIAKGRVGAVVEDKQKTITELAQKERKPVQQAPVQQPEPEPEQTPPTDGNSAPTAAELLSDILARGGKIDAGAGRIEKAAAALRYIEPSDKLAKLDADALAILLSNWTEIADAISHPA